MAAVPPESMASTGIRTRIYDNTNPLQDGSEFFIVRRWHGYKKDVRIPNGVQESLDKGFAVQVLRDVLNICLS
jgi:hypothetical protein